MRFKGLLSAFVAGLLLLAPLPALAAGSSILKSQPAVGSLIKPLSGTHTVYVQPLTFSQAFSKTHYSIVTKEVTKFWAREVPGLKLKFVLKTAKKTTKALACGREASWKYASKVSGIAPKKLTDHLMAWGIGCGTFGLAEVVGSYGFSGADAEWANDKYYDFSSSVFAHELGHNFGFDHSTVMKCLNSAGKRVTLSTSCTEVEYGDTNDIMGSGTITDGSARLSGFYKMKVKPSTLLRKVSAAGGSMVLYSTTNAKAQAALVQSSFGPIIFDFEGGRYEYTNKVTLGVAAHVQLKNKNQGQLAFANSKGVIENGSTLLTLGKGWDIPGTTLRVVVTAVSANSATVSFKKQAKAPTVVAPVLAASTCVPDSSCTVTWATGSSSSGVTGYQLEVDGVLGERLPATATSAVATPGIGTTTASVRVIMLTTDGYSIPSNTEVVNFAYPQIEVSVDGVYVATIEDGETVDVIYEPGMTIEWAFVGSDAKARSWEVTDITNSQNLTFSNTKKVAPGTASWTVPDSVFSFGFGFANPHTEEVHVNSGSIDFYVSIDGN